MQQQGADMLNGPRKISVKYRGLLLKNIEITSILDEVRFRAYAGIKGAATSQDVIDATSFEMILGLTKEVGGQGLANIDPALVAQVQRQGLSCHYGQ